MQRLKLGITPRNLIVDATIFIGFLLATDPRATGQTIHEWLGVAFGAGILTHLLLHWKWIVSTIKRYAWQPLFGRRRQSHGQPALAREQGGAG